MWRKEKKDTSIFTLLLLVALATTPMAITLVVSNNLLHAQTSTSTEVTPTPAPQKKSSRNNKLLFFSDKSINVKQLTPFLWLLLPLSALGGLSLWWLRGRRRAQSGTDQVATTLLHPKEEDSSQTQELSVAPHQASGEKIVSSNVEFDTKQQAENLGPSVHNVEQTTSKQGEGENLLDSSAHHSISVPTPQVPQTNTVDVSAPGTVTAGTSSPLLIKILDNRSDPAPDRTGLRDGAEVVSSVEPQASKIVTSSTERLEDEIDSNVQPEVKNVNNNTIIPANTQEDLNEPLSVGLTSPSWLRFFDIRANPKLENNTIPLSNSTKELPTEFKVTTSTKQPVNEVVLDMVANEAEPIGKRTETKDIPNITKATQPNVTAKAAPATDKGFAESFNVNVESNIVLEPRTSKWGYAFWDIPNFQKEALRQQGGSQLTLRIYDVTNIEVTSQSPQLVQQYECEETIPDRYVAIPTTDRDYMVEIGYVTKGNRWLFLARSEIVRIESHPEQDFWFVADAELIIHGATEPGSTVIFGGHPIKIKSDGTFHLRVPFTNSMIDYEMTAVPSDKKQAKTIRMRFSQGGGE
ncbi:MAG: DUF4912 domain-containing protein [Rhizonema sp. PD37]|nr:DUF4912 domain-containing protein [Rhizonema sp. PD37]